MASWVDPGFGDDPFVADVAGEEVVVTEALRDLRRTALRCRRARLLLDDHPVVRVDREPVAG